MASSLFPLLQPNLFNVDSGYRSQARSNGNQGGPTQRASALDALSYAFNPSSTNKMSAPKTFSTSQGSQRAAAVAALSSVLTAEKKQSHDGSSTKSTSSPPYCTTQEGAEAKGEDSEPKEKIHLDENGTYSYEQLKTLSTNSVAGIDLKRKEAYLSDEEFQTVFGMEKEAFNKLPKWKQDLKKKKAGLF